MKVVIVIESSRKKCPIKVKVRGIYNTDNCNAMLVAHLVS